MEFFDTHSHYNDEAYDEDRKELINEIYKEGITKTVVIGYNIEKSKKAIEIAEENKFMYSAIGIIIGKKTILNYKNLHLQNK